MGKLLQFTGDTLVDIPTNDVLEGAKDKVDEVVVIGWDLDNKLYLASSTSVLPKILWLIKQAEFDIVERAK